MAQTFNRRPYLQDGPRKSDVENHTFDNYKFTGFKEDKNFLEIDQYSFEECNNVYVDNDGLLRSRPSIKRNDVFLDDQNLSYNIKNILRQNNIYLVNRGTEFSIYEGNEYKSTVSGEVLSATSYGDNVYMFINEYGTYKLAAYNKNTGIVTYNNLIYIPETEVQANSDATKVEPKNALTEKTKKIYLYVSSQFSNDLYGKTVTYEAFGETFEIVFDDDSKKTLLREISTVNQYSSWNWLFANGVFFVYKYDTLDDEYSTFIKFDMAYSVDGINFVTLPSLSQEPIKIKMFDDGTGFMCAMVGDDLRLYYYTFGEQSLTQYYTFYNPNYFIDVTFSGNSNRFISVILFASGANYTQGYVMYNNGNSTFNSIDNYGEVTLYDGVVNLYGRATQSSGYYVIRKNYMFYLYDTFSGSATSIFTVDMSNYGAYYDIKLTKNYYSVLLSTIQRSVLIIIDILRYTAKNYTFYSDNLINDIKICPDGESIYNNYYYQKINREKIKLNVPNRLKNILGFYNDNVYALCTIDGNTYILTSYFDVNTPIRLTYLSDGIDTIISPEQIEQLNEYYFRVGNKLYISEYREDDEGNLQWYLPEINIEEFDGFVTMCPLSSTEMGIFTETGIYIVYRSEQQYEMSTGWKYYPYIQIKSKMDVKIRQGSDVLPTYDGTSLIVPTTRGLALMTYQDFVQSTDQKLEFLSDTIYDAFDRYNTREIKLFRYSYWFFVYRLSDNMLFLLDIRNGSWWPMSGNKSLKSFILYNDKPLLLANDTKTYVFDKSADDYKDDDGFVDWYLRSQKLYLGAANYYKHIQNLTFMSHLLGDNDDGYTFKCYLRNTAYRSRVSSDAEGKMWEYNIEMIRSYVLRLNYPKVCEFQYELRMNKENTTIDFTPVPLSLSNITVKYRMGGQIR